MIYWENTINPKLKGKATSEDHFNRLKTLANGNLKKVTKVSKEAKKVLAEVVEDVKSSSKKGK